AEEAVRRLPGNEAAERVLGRVRERQQQIASAVERAYRFEHSQRYSDAIQEWERVRRLWQQYPQISAHIARLTAASQPQPPSAVAEPSAAPAQSAGLSATSMMTAAPAKAPSPAAQVPPKAVSAPTPIKSPVAEEVVVARPAETSPVPEPEVETSPA